MLKESGLVGWVTRLAESEKLTEHRNVVVQGP